MGPTGCSLLPPERGLGRDPSLRVGANPLVSVGQAGQVQVLTAFSLLVSPPRRAHTVGPLFTLREETEAPVLSQV